MFSSVKKNGIQEMQSRFAKITGEPLFEQDEATQTLEKLLESVTFRPPGDVDTHEIQLIAHCLDKLEAKMDRKKRLNEFLQKTLAHLRENIKHKQKFLEKTAAHLERKPRLNTMEVQQKLRVAELSVKEFHHLVESRSFQNFEQDITSKLQACAQKADSVSFVLTELEAMVDVNDKAMPELDCREKLERVIEDASEAGYFAGQGRQVQQIVKVEPAPSPVQVHIQNALPNPVRIPTALPSKPSAVVPPISVAVTKKKQKEKKTDVATKKRKMRLDPEDPQELRCDEEEEVRACYGLCCCY